MGGTFAGILAGVGERAHEENLLGLQRQAESRKAVLDLLTREADRLPESLRPQLFNLAIDLATNPKSKPEKAMGAYANILAEWQSKQRQQVTAPRTSTQMGMPQGIAGVGEPSITPPQPPPGWEPDPYRAARQEQMGQAQEMERGMTRARAAGTLEAQQASGLPPEAFHPGLRPSAKQAKVFMDAEGNAIPLNYDPRAGGYTDESGQPVDPTALGLIPFSKETAPRVGWIQDPQSSTGFSQVQVDRQGNIVATTPNLLPPAGLIPQITQGQTTVVTDQGVFQLPTTSVRQPVLPSRGKGVPSPPPTGAVAKPVTAPSGEQLTRTPAMTRQRAETAQALVGHIDEIRGIITRMQQQGKDIGPIFSRWNDFMAGDVGAGDPDFTELRTQLALLGSGLMLAHVGARGGIQLMTKFTNLLNASRMDAKTLDAALRATESWLNTYAQMGGTFSPGGAENQAGRIVVISPHDGKPYTIDASKLEEALRRGYRRAE